MLLLHGFPQFWWAWRAPDAAPWPTPATGPARWTCAATAPRTSRPRGYDTRTSAADVASVIRSLGRARAPWSSATAGAAGSPGACRPCSPPSPARSPRCRCRTRWCSAGPSFTSAAQLRANAYLAGLQRPFVPERQMTVQRRLRPAAAARVGLTRRHLAHARGGPDATPTRWPCRSWRTPRRSTTAGWCAARRGPTAGASPRRMRTPDRRAGAAAARRATTARCCPSTAAGSAAYVHRPFEEHLVPGAGHFLPEEAPDAVNAHLVRWLDALG